MSVRKKEKLISKSYKCCNIKKGMLYLCNLNNLVTEVNICWYREHAAKTTLVNSHFVNCIKGKKERKA